MPTIIRVEDVHFAYAVEGAKPPVPALAGVDLTVNEGEYIAIVGHNGSGKSTLAKHLNGLLAPGQGRVFVRDWQTTDLKHLRDIRSTVGMVFQSPDNQIVATIVEEDVAFGPENLSVPRDEIVRRVDWALDRVDMQPFRHRAPHLLSGGQKQRVCIAGTLAMKPQVLVLDEATAMLDPLGRREVLEAVRRLNREDGVTVIAVTHHMDEAALADRVIVMAEGRIALQGTPREVFTETARLRELQLDVPAVTQLALALNAGLPDFPANLLSVDEFVSAARERLVRNGYQPSQPLGADGAATPGEPLIQVEHLGHFYMYGTPLQVRALTDIGLDVRRGEVLGIIGHTGSGKSTVVQHFNALLRPHEGTVTIFGHDAASPELDVRAIRRRVGLLFQFPEAQLFEHYVGDDVAYGPRNLKLTREEVRARVRKAMESVGLGFEEFKDRITFGLSGGQMRRVALAGVLALEPEVLALDEPTAGLDPQGRAHLLELILALRHEGITLIIISHDMEELAQICDRLVVVSDGCTVMSGTPREVFAQAEKLRGLGLGVPGVTDAISRLQGEGLLPQTGVALTVAEAVAIMNAALQSAGVRSPIDPSRLKSVGVAEHASLPYLTSGLSRPHPGALAERAKGDAPVPSRADGMPETGSVGSAGERT
jgi:energy-coupling factor transport system ATP-binding protein